MEGGNDAGGMYPLDAGDGAGRHSRNVGRTVHSTNRRRDCNTLDRIPGPVPAHCRGIGRDIAGAGSMRHVQLRRRGPCALPGGAAPAPRPSHPMRAMDQDREDRKMRALPKMKKKGTGDVTGMGLAMPKLPQLPSLHPESPQPISTGPRWRLVGELIVGDCKGCGRQVRSMGLVPTRDRVAFGNPIQGGWYCSECKPREFGRINGTPALAIRGM